jgi:3-keto-5-aminohexanoate cleavage enzyme
VIITCALVGGELESLNPHYPRTFADLVREGVEAANAGAAVLHLHARTEDGDLTQDPAVYRGIAESIRSEVPDVIFNFTSTGSIGMSDEERLRALESAPELATLDCGSLNWGNAVLATSPEFIDRALRAMREHGVRPELHALEAGWLWEIRTLVEKGLVDVPPIVQLTLGGGGAPARVDTLCYLLGLMPADARWSASAVGPEHFPIVAATVALGGNVRTGLEDVVYRDPGIFAASNAELVERTALICRGVGRPVASPTQARVILGL